ncbi:MAG: cytochrome c family protein [Rhizobiales bacterium]|nr:cytochrome c family protein [Hyphomicrobiales bacterium]
MLSRTILITMIVAALNCGVALAGDPEAGAQVFKKCQACHAVGEGAPNKVGPELNGLFGRSAGSVPGYAYSVANKSSGIVWTEEIFAAYIRDPRGYIKGTKMMFAGIKKDVDIADLTAYLRKFDGDGTLSD